MIYSIREKKKIVQIHLDGTSLRQIEKDFGCDRKVVAEWVDRFKTNGEQGLKRKKKARTTYDFRHEVVEQFLEQDISYSQLCKQYNISRAALKKWVSDVRKTGYDSLQGAKLGRPSKKL